MVKQTNDPGMPALADLFERVKSGILNINFINESNGVIAAGSGFMSNGYLVTNNHVFQGPENSRVWIRNEDDSATDLADGLILSADDFRDSLETGSEENNFDYAILNIPELQDRKLYNFDIVNPESLRIGDGIALLGFPLYHRNLTCHAGNVSSFYVKNNVDIIQIDASVNAGNSGGPLISIDTGKVVGIVTRKASGLTNMFDELRRAIRTNISNVKDSGVAMRVGGFDAIKAFEVSQNQMLRLTDEIERSANVGIGYAFSAKHLLEDNAFHHE